MFRQTGNLVATVWKDKRVVSTLSSMTSPQDTTTVDRRQKDASIKHIPCPQSVSTYNTYMNGVDRGDQLRNYYRVRLKSMKYYKYVFWFLFDVSITNAFILSSFVPTTPTTLSSQTLKKFRLALSEQLIGDYNSRKRLGRPRSSVLVPHPPPPLPQPDSGGPPPTQSPRSYLHLPTHTQSRQCVYCWRYREKKRRRESVWCCQECPGHPTLCLTGNNDGSDCFRIWHANLQH